MNQPIHEKNAIVVGERSAQVFSIRGERVMRDEDLARLYGVATGQLNQAVERNIEPFPSASLLSQIVISNDPVTISRRGGRRSPTRVFTEHADCNRREHRDRAGVRENAAQRTWAFGAAREDRSDGADVRQALELRRAAPAPLQGPLKNPVGFRAGDDAT